VKDSFQALQGQMSTAVYEAVKRANAHIQKGQERLLKRREEKLLIENYLSRSNSDVSLGAPSPLANPKGTGQTESKASLRTPKDVSIKINQPKQPKRDP
jgi:hypothetical protein